MGDSGTLCGLDGNGNILKIVVLKIVVPDVAKVQFPSDVGPFGLIGGEDPL